VTTISTPVGKAEATKAEVELLLSSLIDCWNRHDVPALASYFAEDADFVNVLGARMQGRTTIEAQHKRLHETIFRRTVLRKVAITVRLVREDVAVAHVQWEMTGAEPVPGWNVSDPRRGIFSYILVRQNEGWRITAAHNTDTIPLAMP